MMRTQQTGSKRAKLGKYAFFLGSAASLVARASADTVGLFSFETSGTAAGTTGAASGTLAAEVGPGTALGVHASTTAVYSFPAGNASTKAFSSNGWALNDYYQFTINATGYTGLALSFDNSRSNTGPAGFSLQYSTTGTAGSFSTFTTFASSSTGFSPTAAAAGVSNSFDLSGVTALNNHLDYFRLVSDGTNSAGATTIAGTGTFRVDNVLLTGATAAIPEPSSLALLSVAGAAAVVGIRRRRQNA